MILQWILFLATFLTGYAVGQSKQTKQTGEAIIKGIDHAIHPESGRVGAIQRPTAKEVNKRYNPTAIEEEEMKKTFDQFPELKP